MSGVFDDGNDIRAMRGHVYQVPAATVREFHSEDCACGTNDVRDVRDRSPGGGAEVEHFGAGFHVDVFEAAQYACGELGAEGVPDAIFGFGGDGGVAVGGVDGGGGGFDGDAFFAVDGFAWGEVFGDEEVFFAAGYEDAGVTVGFL